MLDEAKDSVESVAVGTTEIVTGSTDGCVRVYDIRMGELRTDTIGRMLLLCGLIQSLTVFRACVQC